MKLHKLLPAVLCIIMAGALLTGCPEDTSPSQNNNSNSPPTDSNPPPTQTTEPNALTQQTMVVLAEMFTADW